MKKKVEEFTGMTVIELKETIHDLKDELFALKMRLAARTLKRTSELQEVKRNIARAKTILREHELGIRELAGE